MENEFDKYEKKGKAQISASSLRSNIKDLEARIDRKVSAPKSYKTPYFVIFSGIAALFVGIYFLNIGSPEITPTLEPLPLGKNQVVRGEEKNPTSDFYLNYYVMNYEAAAIAFGKIENPNTIDSLFLGVNHLMSKNYEDAYAVLSRIDLKQRPSFLESHEYYLAISAHYMNKDEQATRLFENLRRKNSVYTKHYTPTNEASLFQ